MFFTCWEFGEYSKYSSRAPPEPKNKKILMNKKTEIGMNRWREENKNKLKDENRGIKIKENEIRINVLITYNIKREF